MLRLRAGGLRDRPGSLGRVVADGLGLLDRDVALKLLKERYAHEEEFVERAGDNATRIRIGDGDVFLSRGRHTYTIRYTMTRMGRRFESHDELYWNVTGDEWDVPVGAASARIVLPAGATAKATSSPP